MTTIHDETGGRVFDDGRPGASGRSGAGGTSDPGDAGGESAGSTDAGRAEPGGPPPEARRSRSTTDHVRVWLALVWPPLITFAGFLGIWYAYSGLKYEVAARRINTLPFPHEVFRDGFMPLWDPENLDGLRPILGYLWPTLKVTLIGLAISIVVGVAIAVVMNLSKSAERAIFPYAVVLQTVPILAITPLLTQLFGEGIGVRLVVVVLIAIFPVITNTLFGLQSADRLHHDLFTLNRVSRWTRLWKLELPGAVPAIMTGVRIASGGAVIGAVVADFFFTRGEKGIGFYIRVKQQAAAERPEMFAATIMASVFGIVMFIVIGWITRRAIRNWHDSAGGPA